MTLHSRSSGSPAPRRGACALAGMFIVLLALSACSGGKKSPLSQAQTTGLSDAGVFDPMSPQEILKYQPDVRLAARWNGGDLTVTVRNVTSRAITVSYANFGLLANNRKYPITPDLAGIFFPRSVLAPGEMATGHFVLRRAANLVGAHCVFESPATRPSRCVVRAGEPRTPIVAPAKTAPAQPAVPGEEIPASAPENAKTQGEKSDKQEGPAGTDKNPGSVVPPEKSATPGEKPPAPEKSAPAGAKTPGSASEKPEVKGEAAGKAAAAPDAGERVSTGAKPPAPAKTPAPAKAPSLTRAPKNTPAPK